MFYVTWPTNQDVLKFRGRVNFSPHGIVIVEYGPLVLPHFSMGEGTPSGTLSAARPVIDARQVSFVTFVRSGLLLPRSAPTSRTFPSYLIIEFPVEIQRGHLARLHLVVLLGNVRGHTLNCHKAKLFTSIPLPTFNNTLSCPFCA